MAPGFFGDAYLGCRRECEVHADCAPDLACRDYKCVDPCAREREICGVNAECSVVQHNAVCACIPNHVGDPFVRCDPSETCKRICRNFSALDIVVSKAYLMSL